MNGEQYILLGAAIAEELTAALAPDRPAPHEWELVYTGLLASIAGALAQRLGPTATGRVLDLVKASVDVGSEQERRH